MSTSVRQRVRVHSIRPSAAAFLNMPIALHWICRIRSLAYAHRGPDLLQGQRLLTMNEAKTTHDNLPLPLVESLEDPFDLRLPLTLRRLLLVRVGAGVLGRR